MNSNQEKHITRCTRTRIPVRTRLSCTLFKCDTFDVLRLAVRVPQAAQGQLVRQRVVDRCKHVRVITRRSAMKGENTRCDAYKSQGTTTYPYPATQPWPQTGNARALQGHTNSCQLKV